MGEVLEQLGGGELPAHARLDYGLSKGFAAARVAHQEQWDSQFDTHHLWGNLCSYRVKYSH